MINKKYIYGITILTMLSMTIFNLEASKIRRNDILIQKNELIKDIADPMYSVATLRTRTENIITMLNHWELGKDTLITRYIREIKHIIRTAQSKEEYNEVVEIIDKMLTHEYFHIEL